MGPITALAVAFTVWIVAYAWNEYKNYGEPGRWLVLFVSGSLFVVWTAWSLARIMI